MIKSVSLPIQLFAVILAAIAISSFVGLEFVRIAYTFSIFFKDILSFFLPIIVFTFILTSLLSFENRASKIIGIMLALIFCSNILATFLAYLIGCIFLGVQSATQQIIPIPSSNIEPYFRLALPTFIKSEWALVAAIVVGLLLPWLHAKPLENTIKRFKRFLEKALKQLLIPFLPLYVFGFLLKILYEGSFGYLFNNYGFAFILIICAQLLYLLFLYAIAAKFSLSSMITSIKHTLPSYVTGFTTMSSAVTIPVSIECSLKNIPNPALVHLAIPIMANIHLSGAAFSAPLLTLFTLIMYKGIFPSFFVFAPFAFYFCTTLFAVSGIPAGAIIVIMPLLVSHFGFTPEMISIITTIYCLLDPFGTATNVMSDGALIIMLQNILKKLKIA